MNNFQLKRLFPNASQATLAANAEDYGSGVPELETDHSRPVAKLERHTGNGPLEAGQGQEAGPGRVHLSIVSVRKRLCDPDNLAPKWTIDCLRYTRIISGDEPDKITLETTQRKAAKGEAEHTEVTITWPANP